MPQFTRMRRVSTRCSVMSKVRHLKFVLVLGALVLLSILLANCSRDFLRQCFPTTSLMTLHQKDDVSITETPETSSRGASRPRQNDDVGIKETPEASSSGASGLAVKLILVSYMRSGSSFAGDLFNHHSQVFFFYEPFWTIDFFFQRPEATIKGSVHPALFFHQPMIVKEPLSLDQQIASLKQNVMKAVINCDFESMYLGPLLAPKIYKESRSCQPFRDCTRQNPGVLGLHHCLPELLKTCRSASVIATKVVRISMLEVEAFLKADPKVKVIHLVRDPRGVLWSRRTTVLHKVYQQTSKTFCDMVTKDLNDSVSLKKKYPGRIMTARYEDLAEWPLNFSARLLNFAGMDMYPDLQDYVRSITSTHKQDVHENVWGTFRADSGRTAGLWRSLTSFNFTSGVDRDCRRLHQLMGYVPFADETSLRKMDIPYFEDYRRVPGLWNTTVA